MDVVDEQIDVDRQGDPGPDDRLRRCHDHKFDPIPTADYYALAGILRNAKAMEHANVSKWIDVPLPMSPRARGRRRRIRGEDRRAGGPHSRPSAPRLAELGRTIGGAVAVADLPGVVVDDAQARHGRRLEAVAVLRDLHRRRLPPRSRRRQGREDAHLPARARRGRRVRGPARLLARLNRATAVPVTILSADGETHGQRRHAGRAPHRRPIRLAGAASVRDERSGLRPDLQRRDHRTRHRRRRAVRPGRQLLAREPAAGDDSADGRQEAWKPN